MNCPKTEYLAEYELGALPAPRAQAVRRHVATCPHCRQELAALAQLATTLARLPDPPAPGDLWPGIAARLQPKRRPAFLSGWRRLTLAAALTAGLLAAAVTAERGWQGPVASPAPASYLADNTFLTAQDPLTDRAGLALALAVDQSE